MSLNKTGADYTKFRTILQSLQREWPVESRHMLVPLKATHASIDEIGSLFDEAIGTFSAMLAVHRSRANVHCGINRLPIEVLSSIFRMVGSCGLNYQYNLDLSHTCALWRDICIGYPEMWSCIDVTSIPRRIVPLFSRRSKTFPMTIVRGADHRLVDWDGEFSAEHIHRCRSMALDMHNGSNWQWVMEKPAPLLESFRVRCSGSPSSLPYLFARTCPNLRRLKLRGIRMPWVPGVYANLTHLHIDTKIMYRADRDVLSIFRESPLLQECIIDTPVPPEEWLDNLVRTTPFPARPIFLDHLRKLIITAPLKLINLLLCSLAAPDALEELHVQISPLSGNDSPSVVLNPLSMAYEVLSQVVSLSIDTIAAAIIGHGPGKHGRGLSFSFHHIIGSQDLLEAIFQNGSMASLETLHFADRHFSYMAEGFPLFLARIPTLKHLCLSDAIHRYLDAMAYTIEDQSFLPHLTNLGLYLVEPIVSSTLITIARSLVRHGALQTVKFGSAPLQKTYITHDIVHNLEYLGLQLDRDLAQNCYVRYHGLGVRLYSGIL